MEQKLLFPPIILSSLVFLSGRNIIRVSIHIIPAWFLPPCYLSNQLGPGSSLLISHSQLLDSINQPQVLPASNSTILQNIHLPIPLSPLHHQPTIQPPPQCLISLQWKGSSPDANPSGETPIIRFKWSEVGRV